MFLAHGILKTELGNNSFYSPLRIGKIVPSKLINFHKTFISIIVFKKEIKKNFPHVVF